MNLDRTLSSTSEYHLMTVAANVLAQKEIYIQLDGLHRPLERAAKMAIDQALWEFGIDESGHSDKVADWERSSCSINVEFVSLRMSGGMGGWGTVVTFKIWCEKNEDG
jgi:hypothetical protein